MIDRDLKCAICRTTGHLERENGFDRLLPVHAPPAYLAHTPEESGVQLYMFVCETCFFKLIDERYPDFREFASAALAEDLRSDDLRIVDRAWGILRRFDFTSDSPPPEWFENPEEDF